MTPKASEAIRGSNAMFGQLSPLVVGVFFGATMSERKSYRELLDDPRWQKKRLEVLEKNQFTCRGCGSKEKKLNVHHRMYKKGRKPWEYELIDLTVLCEDCHEKWHSVYESICATFAYMEPSELIELYGIKKGAYVVAKLWPVILIDAQTESFMDLMNMSGEK